MTNHKYRIAFYKFNTEQKKLGVNVFDMDELRPSLYEGPVFREAFITTYFICGGIERLTVNGHTREVSRGDVICTLPGEIWEWTGDTHLEGYCVIFEKGFITDFFRDECFLNRFQYLRPDRPTPFMRPNDELLQRVLRLLRDMLHEQHSRCSLDNKSHIMRAQLYELLMLLARAVPVGDDMSPMNANPINRHINYFVQLVDNHFREEHGVEYYARQMAVSSNYLNKIVHLIYGMSTKAYINDKLLKEACQQLIYTHKSLKEIALMLCFEDVPYFVRFFSKNKGMSPIKYRESMQEKI